MDGFKFNLGDNVALISSGEAGVVRGRAQYLPEGTPASYYVHYVAADGKAVSEWWSEDLLRLSIEVKSEEG